MADAEKVVKGLVCCSVPEGHCTRCPYEDSGFVADCTSALARDALELLKEQDARIKKYEYVFDFLGIGFREWATKILEGEAEVICEANDHKRETVIRFKHI